MKLSKLLKFLLAFALPLYVDEEGGGGASASDTGALDMTGASAAFASFLGDESSVEEQARETPEDRAARLLSEDASATGDDDEDEEGNGEETQAAADQVKDEPITIEVDGKQVTLSKADVAEHYKNGLRQKDYTQKTMEAAEVRKAAEAETAKARTERETYAAQLKNFEVIQTSQLQDLAGRLTDELLETDPVEYLRLQRIQQTGQAKLTEAKQEFEKLKDQYLEEQRLAGQNFIHTQHQQLVDKLPELKDPAKFQPFIAGMDAFLTENGFTKDDGSIVLDHRLMLMADKAMKYDALLKRAGAAPKKLAAVPPKVERSGVKPIAPTDGRTAAVKQLAKTGSVRDAAPLFEAFV